MAFCFPASISSELGQRVVEGHGIDVLSGKE